MSINNSKLLIRKEVKNKLLSLGKDSKIDQAKNVAQKLLRSEAFKTSERISIYLSTEQELCTESIVKEIFRLNKSCFVPRCNQKEMDMVRLSSLQDFTSLPLNKWGIKEPNLSEKRENALDAGGLDLIVVPGLAFTKDGHRLGYGAGYYDRYFKKFEDLGLPKPKTIALAFREQILEHVPTDQHDYKVDLVIFDENKQI